MSYTPKKKLCPIGLGNNPNKDLKALEYITIHCTGNYSQSSDAASHAEYLYSGSGGRKASWHYTADSKEIWQSFEDNRECWHAGDGNNGPGNSTSVGIEICVNDKNGFASACDNAARLTADLLIKHGLDIDKVVQHNEWSGKDCPHELRSGGWGVTWDDFTALVSKHKGENTLTAAVTSPSEWAEAAWNWAVSAGITDGTNPQVFSTREQVVQLIYNAFNALHIMSPGNE